MNKVKKKIYLCNNDDIVAEDIFNNVGITLVVKNTFLDNYIKNKLTEFGISEIYVYEKDIMNNPTIATNDVRSSYYNTVIVMKQFINELSARSKAEYTLLIEITNDIYACIKKKTDIFQCLSEIKDTDEYTYYHSINVAFYAMLLADWMEFNEEDTRNIILAGLLHDIGKTKIPSTILNKNGKLTDKEYEIIKKHPSYGYEIIKTLPEINANVLDAVIHHHERMDGSGYPDKIQGNCLGLFARIIAIVDVYDAMTQDRVYKGKVTPFESFQMFMSNGISSFDTKILLIFVRNLSAFYAGMKVLLSDGQYGVIVYVPPHDIINPVVQVGPRYIDISREQDLKIIKILPW